MADEKKVTSSDSVKAQAIKDAAAATSKIKSAVHDEKPNMHDEGFDNTKAVDPRTLDKAVSLAAEQEHFVAGFNFDMVQLTELYAMMRDGNYWSAFKLVITILNQNVNPAPITRGLRTSAIAARMQVPVRLSEVDDICEKLEGLCDNLESDQVRHTRTTGSKEAVRASREPGVEAIDPIVIIGFISMVIDLIKKWRQSRS